MGIESYVFLTNYLPNGRSATNGCSCEKNSPLTDDTQTSHCRKWIEKQLDIFGHIVFSRIVSEQ